MNKSKLFLFIGFIVAISAGAETLVLKASKDNFGRSNKRNRNSGASEKLVIAKASNIRTLIAFDLSSVTNEIVSAELRFHQSNSADKNIDLIVAPMVNTSNNVLWVEGLGNLGVSGQNSQVGESCYAYRAFRDSPWESALGKPLVNLADKKLWETPVANLKSQRWKEGNWLKIAFNDATILEKIRSSETPVITLGVWGTDGDGLYFLSSKDSGLAPELHLTIK